MSLLEMIRQAALLGARRPQGRHLPSHPPGPRPFRTPPRHPLLDEGGCTKHRVRCCRQLAGVHLCPAAPVFARAGRGVPPRSFLQGWLQPSLRHPPALRPLWERVQGSARVRLGLEHHPRLSWLVGWFVDSIRGSLIKELTAFPREGSARCHLTEVQDSLPTL